MGSTAAESRDSGLPAFALTGLLALALAATLTAGDLLDRDWNAPGPRVFLDAAPAAVWAGLVIGGALALAVAVAAERRGALQGRRTSVLGAALAGLGASIAAPWLLLVIMSVPGPPPATPPGVAPLPAPAFHGPTFIFPLAVPAVTALLAPAAFVAIAQALAAWAGRGRPAPLRTPARWARRVATALAAGITVLPGLSASRPWAGAALCAAAALLPLVWARAVRRLEGPSARLVLIGAAGGALVFARDTPPEMVVAGLLNFALPPLAIVIALRRARLDRVALDALGIEVDAPGDLAAATIAATVGLYALVGVTLAGSARPDLLEWLVKDAFALCWAPVLTTVAAAGVLLRLGRIVGAARAQAAALEARRREAAPA